MNGNQSTGSSLLVVGLCELQLYQILSLDSLGLINKVAFSEQSLELGLIFSRANIKFGQTHLVASSGVPKPAMPVRASGLCACRSKLSS